MIIGAKQKLKRQSDSYSYFGSNFHYSTFKKKKSPKNAKSTCD